MVLLNTINNITLWFIQSILRRKSKRSVLLLTLSATFWSVFLAVSLAEIAKMVFERWFKATIDSRLDDIDSKLRNLNNKINGVEKK